MKAVLTLDNGEKFIADIYPLQGKKQHRPRFHDEYDHIVCVNGHRAKDIHEREYSS